MTKHMYAEVECVVDADNYIGETPVWSVSEQALYWVNCEAPPELHRWDYASREHRVWPMPERIGGLVLRSSGGPLIALSSGLFDLDPASGDLARRIGSPLGAGFSLHECQCDRQGRFWIGSMDHSLSMTNLTPQGGGMFRLDGDRLTRVFGGVSCSNGLAFSPDGRILYHCDSPTGIVMQWDVELDTGELSNGREFVRYPASERGGFDGATVDAEGGYWVTAVFGSALLRYHPDGTLDLRLALPFSAPTKIAFGGPDLDTVFVTTTKMAAFGPIPVTAKDGSLYALKPGVRGLPDPLFQA